MISKPNETRHWCRFGDGRVLVQHLTLLLCGVFTLWVFIGQPPAYAAENTLKDVTYSALPGNRVKITLTAANSVNEPKTFSTENPARIAMDFMGMTNGLSQKTLPIGIGMARSVTAIEAGGRTRVVVNLVGQADHEIKVVGNQVQITLGGEQGSLLAQSGSKTTSSGMVTSSAGNSIANVDFRRGDSGEGRVILQLTDPAATVNMRDEGGRVILEIQDTTLPERLRRQFDVGDFATPVRMFSLASRGNQVQVNITTAGEYENLAYQTDDLFTVEFRPLTKAEKEEIQRRKKTFTGERLSLNFQDIEVRAVLQLLADFTGLNLVTSDTVQGRITLRLQNVPWDQSLDIILKARGLSMRQNGNVIMIAPTEEIAAREKLELESQRQIEELAPLHSEYIQINYAKAEDLQKLLKTKGNELLTPDRGNVTVDPRTNTLLVRDTAAKLEDIRRLVKKLDVPVRQVLIESRVVIANNDFSRDLGVRFGFNSKRGIGDTDVLVGGGKEGFLDNTAFIAPGYSVDSKENLLVNLPATLGGERGGSFNMLIGKVGSFLLQLQLSAMQEEGKGEVVSAPRVITSDKHKAVIKQGMEIPYQEAASSGATSVSFKEAVLMLEVTPNITPDDRIIMDLVITKDRADFSRSVLGTPPIDTRSVETNVLVDNGETVVLGGVFEREKSEDNEKIPFFGDLPYVGFLFNEELVKDNNNELLIFITPKILKETLGVR